MLRAWLLLAISAAALAGEACCAAKRAAALAEASEPPPFDASGRPRFISDPNVPEPSDWDAAEDGIWEANLVPNPAYEAPVTTAYATPSAWDQFLTEVRLALPWVVLGVVVTASLEAVQVSASHTHDATQAASPLAKPLAERQTRTTPHNPRRLWPPALLPTRETSHALSPLLSSCACAQLPMRTLAKLLTSAGPLGGALIGLATPLCSCGALPVAAGFVASGAPLGSVVAFLTASQSAGIDSAAITYGLLGPTAAACRHAHDASLTRQSYQPL